MGFPLLSVIGVVVAAVATLFTVIGLATAGWIVSTFRGISVGTGLFQICAATTCVDIPATSVEDALIAIRAMVIIGFLLGVACVVVLVVYTIKNDMKIMQLVGIVLAFVAAFFILVGIIIYGAEFNKLPANSSVALGYSFALTVLGAILFLIAGIIVVVEKFVKGSSDGKIMQG